MTKDCCQPKNKNKHKSTGGVDSFLVSIVVITLIVVGGAVYFGTRAGATTQVVTDSQVELVANTSPHDWGTIDIGGGIVSKSYAIENKSNTPLKLYDVKTSCMCTTAQLITSSQSSKKFGMHEKNSSVFEVMPGESAELLVEFDPAFHGPSGVGPISRTVTLSTNDANNPTLSFQLSANVAKL